jgi:hypothetical protein
MVRDTGLKDAAELVKESVRGKVWRTEEGSGILLYMKYSLCRGQT